MTVAEIRNIQGEIESCQKRLSIAICATYPIGCDVRYELGSGFIICEVVMHGGWDRLKLRNVETDKTRWVEGDSVFLSPFVPAKQAVRK